MQDVPKIVLKRLQDREAAGTHPDADLLTAFAEQSLIESERAHVMEHLAHCSDCREVVAFALPATETVAVTASTSPARTGWLSWLALRWSVALAGIIAITLIGIVQFRQRAKSDTLVANLTQSNDASPEAQPALPPSPAAPESQADNSQTQKEGQAQVQKKAPSGQADNLALDKLIRRANPTLPTARAMQGASSRGVMGGSARVDVAGGAAPKAALSSPRNPSTAAGYSGNAVPAEAAKTAPNPSVGRAVEVPSSSQTVQVESQAAPATGTAQNQASDQLAKKQKDQAPQYRYSINSGVNEAKNPATAQAASGSVSAPAPAPPNVATPQWSISADGALQRSFDAGRTWADVNVNSEPLSGRSNMVITAESTSAPENKKKKVEAQPRPVFRAVSAWDSEIWAGGSSAMLYHSADSGTHWTRMLPSSSGATLTGDIISIEFSDSQHGKIATSTGEVWITPDDGKTWRRQ